MPRRADGRRFRARVAVAVALMWTASGIASAFADDGNAGTGEALPSTATLQEVLPLTGDLYVVLGGDRISALPVRLRVDDQASPLAYSLDIRRPAQYGDSWTGAAVIPDSNGEFPANYTGVRRVDLATVVARGSLDSALVAPAGDLEYAARQVAIWSLTSQFKISGSSVPDAALRRRSLELVDLASRDATFPIQLSSHGVSIYLRSVSGNTVTFTVKLELEANRRLQTPADVDLSLDGQLVSVKTGQETRLRGDAGSYRIASTTALPSFPGDDDPAKAGPNNFANVVIDRNTNVVDVTANWVNVTADPGLLFIASGLSAPLLTADQTVLNINASGAGTLDPADYGGPTELVTSAASWALANLPTWLLWVSLFGFLYLVSRAAWVGDKLVLGVTRRARVWWLKRHPPEQLPAPSVRSVRVQAPTAAQAIALAKDLLGSDEALDVHVIQSGRTRMFGPDRPSLVEVSIASAPACGGGRTAPLRNDSS